MLRHDTVKNHEVWLWLAAFLLILLFFGCLALVVINTGPGFGGEALHFRLVSAVTNYPFCPPSVPCPISVVLQNNHWVVWAIAERRTPPGVEINYRKLIDISLWK